MNLFLCISFVIVVTMSEGSSWNYLPGLTSVRTSCDECKGSLDFSSDPPAELTIYTRNGTKFSRHLHKECPNRWCRKRFFYGFSIKNGIKVYESLAGKAYLVTSSETAFSLDFCLEMTLHCVHNNATFQGLENVYNQMHNYNRQNITRVNLNRKRLATAFFLYSFLEFTTRNGILHEFSCGDSWLDNTILTQISLQVHVQIHTDTFVEHCSYCEKNFKNINSLLVHKYRSHEQSGHFSALDTPPHSPINSVGNVSLAVKDAIRE